jgi:hypothetical protein
MSAKKENRSARSNARRLRGWPTVLDRLLMNLSEVFLKQFNPSKEIRIFLFFARMLECVAWPHAEYAETVANRRGREQL